MFKLLLLLGVASVALGDDIRSSKMYSSHTRFTPGTLDMSTSELKVFSGHAMNIVRAKCPDVDAKKVFQIQKYMGKLLAKKEPTPAKSKEFRPLIDSMTSCAKEGPIPQPAASERHHFLSHSPFVSPFHPAEVKTSADSTEIPAPAVVTVPRIITTTIVVRPQDVQKIRSSGGFFNWIHGIFSKVGGFFKNIFPFGHRSKRDVSGEEMPIPIPSGSDEPLLSLSPYQVFTPVKAEDQDVEESRGKQAFGTLIDQWCRIYCDSCSGKKEIHNFKLAAKQLLEDLFEEDSGIEAAAQQYLDDDFLASIKNCE